MALENPAEVPFSYNTKLPMHDKATSAGFSVPDNLNYQILGNAEAKVGNGEIGRVYAQGIDSSVAVY